jgi:hypothetical protein
LGAGAVALVMSGGGGVGVKKACVPPPCESQSRGRVQAAHAGPQQCRVGEQQRGATAQARERMVSPTVQTLQDPILLLPWVCFRVAAFQTLSGSGSGFQCPAESRRSAPLCVCGQPLPFVLTH